ncbi:MAG: mitochondral 37S ribosomal protein S27 [Phylliscum demangeonii]|nr:MAG: mitochondral 37S ribosomal protein S27 [Phylliscum demangeonii]
MAFTTAVPRSRLLDLMKVQCRIFGAAFNPNGLRLGNKILRQRLKGPALAAYYPPRVGSVTEMARLYPNLDTWDDFEEDRVEGIQIAKSRGKGAPTKKRTGEGSKKAKAALAAAKQAATGV